MRAGVLEAPRTFKIKEVSVPEPEPGQVLLRLEGCGVCASNLLPWKGPEWMNFPTEPGGLGHEGWGRVVAVGKGASTSLMGRRVAALSRNSYAEYDVADAQSVIPLPDALDDQAFPGEPLGCAMNIYRRANIRKGETVAIVGIGFLGAILTQLAVSEGANVIAISRRLFTLTLAKQFGAAAVLPMDDKDAIVEKVRDLTGGKLCDCVLEMTGHQEPLDLAAELTAERGRLVIGGYHQDAPRQVDMQLWNWRGLDVINAHERDPKIYVRGVNEAISAVLSGQINPAPLFTHTYPINELNKAFQDAVDKPPNFMKALITYG
ncbi:zinc-binding dehydrogenase [Rhizobium sp. L1K21]|uniref:MDR/zinc-dependent alcohol dehydrogenase-like family protein n=1 Tax=Rhizobium sp. L1K21 TaxID=2954933 RepID=UPI0020920E4A|nr:zinc-binding dehydrogenase [Rhizobium sp. L1K21]MCO6187794.1 zinc-binding dehydrogenase [Rhizobium sp. L1K21]